MGRCRGLLLVVGLVLVTGCAGDGAPPGDDPLLRSVLAVEVDSRGLLEMDLRTDPPTMQAGYDDATAVVPVTDLDAARALRRILLDLPPLDQGCPRLEMPRFTGRVATYPTPEDAPFADLAVHDVGGPCADITDEEIQEIVDLWNAAGGSIEVEPRR